MNSPDTRPSLLIRIRDASDHEAWTEFGEIYRPIIVRLAVAKGLQPADAEDLAQQVLISISKAIERWQPDGSAKFRTWLRKITQNAILNAITRAKADRASGGGQVYDLLERQIASDAADSLLQIEYRREVLNWAARHVRAEFSDDTWQAFWMTAVDGHDINVAANQLGKSRGAVYAARSRVMRRLREAIETLEEE